MGRRPRARGPRIDGLLVVDKPVGVTSMDVVRRVRAAAQGCRTGHAGTLDPLASGVVVCCLGRATRAVEHLMGLAKVYRGEIDLGAFTDTDDAEGEPRPVAVAEPPGEEAVRAALAGFVGEIDQVPPAYSALKVAGRPAYALARRGETVELAARRVRIDEIRCERYAWPIVELAVRCGRGTYIRSLARDLGRALGTGGHLRSLRRTAVGPYTVEEAVALDAVPRPLTAEHLLPAPAGAAT